MRLRLVCIFLLRLWLDEGIEDGDQDLPTLRASCTICTKVRISDALPYELPLKRRVDYLSIGLQIPRDVDELA
jgi:hypothetical protein